MPPRVSLIAAVARNGVIGWRGGIPWRLPSDLRHFRRQTLGQPVIMGRRTWESIAARRSEGLDGRANIVISGDRGLRLPAHVRRAESPAMAYEIAERLCVTGSGAEIWIIGGAAIYEAFMERADRLVLTEVAARPEGDAHFPRYDDESLWRNFKVTAHENPPRAAHDETDFRFITYERALPT